MIEEDSSRAAIPSSPYNYRCKECDKVFPNAKELTHHYRMDHPEGLWHKYKGKQMITSIRTVVENVRVLTKEENRYNHVFYSDSLSVRYYE